MFTTRFYNQKSVEFSTFECLAAAFKSRYFSFLLFLHVQPEQLNESTPMTVLLFTPEIYDEMKFRAAFQNIQECTNCVKLSQYLCMGHGAIGAARIFSQKGVMGWGGEMVTLEEQGEGRSQSISLVGGMIMELNIFRSLEKSML